jgi:hypothetical protein
MGKKDKTIPDEMRPRILELQGKIQEHFQQVDAVAQVVLKGHLLIEEALDKIIGKFLFHPEHFEEASLRFPQKIDLARSMSLDEHNNEMWQLAILINTLRNELAHSLKSDKRQRKTQSVIDLYLKLLEDKEMVDSHKDHSKEVILMWAVTFFLGFLGAFEAEIDRFRSFVDGLDHIVNPHRHTIAYSRKVEPDS